jgi:hypothetical protein
MLEEQMQEIRGLPARVAGVELQIVQLREEMRESFSAIRTELGGNVDGLYGRMDGLRDELRTEMHGIRDELRTEMHGIRDDLRAEMRGMRDELLTEIRDGDHATRNFMKTLFEHHQSNLRTIGEGTPRKGRKR